MVTLLNIASGINNTPLHGFHQGDKTFDAYTNIPLCFVFALCRDSADYHYRFPFTATVRTEINNLKAAIEDQAMDITAKCAVLHRVFLSLWHCHESP
jgi:hypothetical protein